MKILSLSKHMLMQLIALSESEWLTFFKIDVSKKCLALLTLNA